MSWEIETLNYCHPTPYLFSAYKLPTRKNLYRYSVWCFVWECYIYWAILSHEPNSVSAAPYYHVRAERRVRCHVSMNNASASVFSASWDSHLPSIKIASWFNLFNSFVLKQFDLGFTIPEIFHSSMKFFAYKLHTFLFMFICASNKMNKYTLKLNILIWGGKRHVTSGRKGPFIFMHFSGSFYLLLTNNNLYYFCRLKIFS